MIEIRETTSEDIPQVLALYPKAFPEEELRPVVSALLAEERSVLSLAALEDRDLVAHVIFTICGTDDEDQGSALLGPLGVIPSHQGKGLGTSIVRDGLGRLAEAGIGRVFVLGDPGYYQRFGFSPERQVLTPCPIPEEWSEAWQSVSLGQAKSPAVGQLVVPEPWREPALWGP